MVEFLTKNFLLCLSGVYVILAMIMSLKLSRCDIAKVDRQGRNFAELPVTQRHKLLIKGKKIKLTYAVVSAAAWIFLTLKLSSVMLPATAVLISAAAAVVSVFVLFELTLFASCLLRKIIDVSSPSLNVIFSSLVFIIGFFCIYICSVKHTGIDVYHFIMIESFLLCCYVIMLIAMILVLKEATAADSMITLKNLWKSVFLTIVLFLVILTLMSFACVVYDRGSFSGAENNIFDMFYYTAVTFATVGYGDIVPISYAAKAVSVLTVVTSIICITVFLSEIAGVKKKLS